MSHSLNAKVALRVERVFGGLVVRLPTSSVNRGFMNSSTVSLRREIYLDGGSDPNRVCFRKSTGDIGSSRTSSIYFRYYERDSTGVWRVEEYCPSVFEDFEPDTVEGRAMDLISDVAKKEQEASQRSQYNEYSGGTSGLVW